MCLKNCCVVTVWPGYELINLIHNQAACGSTTLPKALSNTHFENGTQYDNMNRKLNILFCVITLILNAIIYSVQWKGSIVILVSFDACFFLNKSLAICRPPQSAENQQDIFGDAEDSKVKNFCCDAIWKSISYKLVKRFWHRNKLSPTTRINRFKEHVVHWCCLVQRLL